MKNFTPRFVCVTNIPSSYRLYQFERLNEAFAGRGVQFEVVFMAQSESGRHWRFQPMDWTFRSRIAGGLHVLQRDTTFHLNPEIVASLLRKPPTWLLLGGGWHLPTVTLASAATRLAHPHTALLFWVEGTLSYSQYSRSGAGHSIKRAALSVFDAFVVPGQSSVDYAYVLFDRHAKPYVNLANSVDEREYFLRVNDLRPERPKLRAKFNVRGDVVLLWPARLIPEKGILEFLTAIAELPPQRFEILIAGDGPLRQPIQAFLDDHRMSHVKLLGHQDHAALLELYALSDVLLLPSLRETYGFVAVEALWAGLPLLLSDKVGALPEVLVPGENGWSFDPCQKEQAIGAVECVLRAEPAVLTQMGMRSVEIARDRFDGQKAARSFVDNLLDLLPPRRS